VKRKSGFLIGLLVMVLLTACASGQATQVVPEQPLTSDGIIIKQPTPVPSFTIPAQRATPTPRPIDAGPQPPGTVPATGVGAAPYGPPPPVTTEELGLTQKLFALINHDRAVRGLYPFVWNAILAGGARLHAWNMYHCGFSHYCPDGRSPCRRISDEGIHYTDCGENIAYAGPYPTPWGGAYNIQEGMINEPPTGWHRRQLTSRTFHRVGVGVYVDPSGYIWFVEDLAS
jgi:uncharacterized protein YkwD